MNAAAVRHTSLTNRRTGRSRRAAGAAAEPEPFPSRAFRVKGVVALGMAAGLGFSPRLWLGPRAYPLTPVADWLPMVPPPYDVACYALLLGLLALVVVLSRPRGVILVIVAAAGWRALGDQSRWQPWFYQYLLMLAALAAAPWAGGRGGTGSPSPDWQDRLLNPCRVIVAFTYLYSGLQKCHAAFFADVVPWLLEPTLRHVPAWAGPPLLAVAVAVPAAEALIGVGLLVNRARPAAIGLAVGMHAFILWTIGPWGHGWNSVVWPWNVTMVALVLLLFTRTGPLRPWPLLWGGRRDAFPKLVLLLFGVMPALSFTGRWDLYLSAALYSGNAPRGTLAFGDDVYRDLPAAVRGVCRPTGRDQYEVELMLWSVAEMNVPVNPAERVQVNVARHVSRRWPAGAVVLTIDGRPAFRDGRRVRVRHTFVGGQRVGGERQ